MKKMITFLLAAAILLCGAALAKGSFEASAKISPTAHTITVPPDATTGKTSTSAPTGADTTSPSGSTSTPVSGSTENPSATKATTGTGTSAPTTPDGSTITGTAKPDVSPDSPKTGETSAEVFLFAGIAFAAAGSAVLLRKHKENA